jgi:hypothetical protein
MVIKLASVRDSKYPRKNIKKRKEKKIYSGSNNNISCFLYRVPEINIYNSLSFLISI